MKRLIPIQTEGILAAVANLSYYISASFPASMESRSEVLAFCLIPYKKEERKESSWEGMLVRLG